VAVLGVTFKPNTDDMREAPSLTIVPALLGGGSAVRVTDPEGRREGAALLPGVSWHDDAYAAAEGADAVVLLTEWNEFRALDLDGRSAQYLQRRRCSRGWICRLCRGRAVGRACSLTA
jgi:UDPglucose 6-dehydrogenase